MFNFKFAPKPIKIKINRNNNNTFKRISKLIKGVVFIENGIYKVKVSLSPGSYRILEFTPESYKLKGKLDIFNRVKTNKEKRIRYIRHHSSSIAHPGNPELYVPFAPTWVISGYIVSIEEKELFDFIQLLAKEGHDEELNDIFDYDEF